MKNRINSLFYSLLIAVFAVGCAESDDYSTPGGVSDCVDETIGKTANITGTEVYAMATDAMQQFPEGEEVEELYLEAYITSSDGGGNFFKTISLETEDRKGLSISVDTYNYYIKGFEVGRKVLIKLNGLHYRIQHSSLALGVLYTNPATGEESPNVGRIPEVQMPQVIFKSCEYLTDDELVYKITAAEANNNNYINKLIELDSVQFIDMGQPYYDPSLPSNRPAPLPSTIGGATNRYIVDKDDNIVLFRTGSFATYAGYTIPYNSGKIRGVMTKFNSDFQFIARVDGDIKLDRPALGSEEEPEEPEEPGEGSETSLGGTAIEFLSSFTEDFESYDAGVVNYNPGPTTTFPKYINEILSGPRYWSITSFGGNNYIQMSAHNTNSTCKAYFIVPANLTEATLSFKTKDGYNNGAALKVYYTTDYTAHSNLAEATLVDITSNFTIATGSTTGYADNFTNSGTHTISAGGNGFIIFEYSGTHPSGTTTTYQIDDIVVE
ncbi:MAG: DUF5689 domain-containing protein [Flavobacteriaceae bacterium]